MRRDLAALPDDLAHSALALGALAVARVMDNQETDPTQMASCYRALQAGLDRLRKLAPPKETNDGVDQLAAKRAQRRARSAKT